MKNRFERSSPQVKLKKIHLRTLLIILKSLSRVRQKDPEDLLPDRHSEAYGITCGQCLQDLEHVFSAENFICNLLSQFAGKLFGQFAGKLFG